MATLVLPSVASYANILSLPVPEMGTMVLYFIECALVSIECRVV
jgi:hypothetical protein